MNHRIAGIPLCLAVFFLFISSACMGQTAPVPEFFGIYATTDGKLIPLSGGRGSFTPPQQNLNFFDWNDMNAQPRKVLSLEGSDLRFTVFDAAVADASANIELYKLPFARNVLPQQDALGQVGGLLGQISGQPQPKSAPVSMQKYVIAKTDALKIELLQKPIPGQPQMIQLVPEAPLEPGMYSIFAQRSQGGQQVIVTVPFEWNSSSAGAAKPYCVDLAITGGYGGSMENHDARLEHPYYLAKQKYVECGAATSSTSASTFDTTPSNVNSGGAVSAACNGYADCFKAGIKSYEAANPAEAMADFHAASQADPTQGQAWYWQGVVMLKGHQINQVEQLARVWDKALSLGSTVAISACHERGIQACERGDLMLSPKFVSFSRGSAQIFNVPPQQIEPGKIQNNAAFAHAWYSFKIAGKNNAFDFIPSTWQTCRFDLMVQCPQSGYAEQLILTQYVAQTLPKLASGAFTIITSGGSAQRGPTGTDQTAPTTPTVVTTPSQTNSSVPKISANSSGVKPTITEFDLPTSLFPPSAITTGPDGSLWFTAGNKIGRITTAGSVTGYEVPTAKSGVMGITLGPDGAVWFVETTANKIGRITAAGTIREFPLPSQDVPTEIASGSDGALWFTASAVAKIGRITTSGSITEYPLPVSYSQPSDITAGPDGALWFTENSAKKIGRISVGGAIREFSVPSSNGYPTGIASGPDGALWFTEPQGGKIGRITTEGVITEYPLHADNSNPLGIAAGPDGALWFTDNSGNKIGRITTGGNVIEYDLPTFTSNPGMGITKGPDDALWFTESGKIGRVNLAGKPSESGAPK